ncbi:flavodoxin family protein [Streptomyces sp. NPDC048275]|uniref:flavodoxin family protein n=1 Tax=Streptomyces sp. NPDC048275 TaxID=3155629 RepID=UPI0033DAD79D
MFQDVIPQPRVAIAFHSGYGHTAVLAEAVRRGAEKAGAHVAFIQVDATTDEQWSELDAADAVIFGTPTYMGGASAGFRKFAQATSRRSRTSPRPNISGHASRSRPQPLSRAAPLWQVRPPERPPDWSGNHTAVSGRVGLTFHRRDRGPHCRGP